VKTYNNNAVIIYMVRRKQDSKGRSNKRELKAGDLFGALPSIASMIQEEMDEIDRELDDLD
jgi:hypothetical protein